MSTYLSTGLSSQSAQPHLVRGGFSHTASGRLTKTKRSLTFEKANIQSQLNHCHPVSFQSAL